MNSIIVSDVENILDSIILFVNTSWKNILFYLILKFPYISLAIIIINISMYLNIEYNTPEYNNLVLLSDNRNTIYYSWITYSVLHMNALHIISNMIGFLLIGPLIEIRHSSIRFTIIYILSVTGCGFLFANLYKNISLVGASGGIFGLMACKISNLIINWDTEIYSIKLYYSIIIPSIAAIHLTLLFLNKVDNSISSIAHLGGFITGLLSGIIFLINKKEREIEKKIKIISIYVLSTLLITGGIKLFILNN
jgi:membrane associated rhomboid family serine protease